MTDRVQRLHVTLTKEYRTDDVQSIVDAISMVKGVAKVDLADPIDASDYMARTSVFSEFTVLMYQLLHEAGENSQTYKQIKALLKAESETG